MRVRITLEEKGIDWVSHHLDLRKKETVTAEYFGIHPKGLVPTLVHDGVVHIESTDIIRYLDDTFKEPPLRLPEHRERDETTQWLEKAANIHLSSVKIYIYANKMQKKLKKSDDALALYRSLQKDTALLSFHEKIASGVGLPKEEVDAAERRLCSCFDEAEARLSQHQWLVGNQFTLADIAWIPLHFTLIGAGFPFEKYPRVSEWAEAIRERPSFKQGVLKWCAKF